MNDKTGLGSFSSDCGVNEMLRSGFPRLALARAMGVPFAPYIMNVKATFESADTQSVPNQGADAKCIQDTLIDAMETSIVVAVPATNPLQPISDFFNKWQSGLEATLEVQGAPRYVVTPKPTPLATLSGLMGNGKWPSGWVLSYQQQLFMSFNAPFALPNYPVQVCCTFRGWVPTSDMFISMSAAEALSRLQDMGVEVPTNYLPVGR
ncbi:MAG: hypothetical protein KGK07_16220 [Chloroflexota bacterium]|nr:hypothetical protein [Chloroflexota bacterium]